MGCTCSKGRNALDENLNEIIEDTRISYIYPEEYLLIIKKAIKSKKDLNEKFNFQTEIIEIALKSTNLFLPITYLKNILTNLPEENAKCLLTLSLLFLCKFISLENLKKNFSELFTLVKNQIEGLEEVPNKNNFYLIQRILEFYAALVSKHLLDVYAFSLSEIKKDLKEMIYEFNIIFGKETIKLFTESLFDNYKQSSFEVDKFFDENFSMLDPNILREKLRETFLKNETSIRSNNKIVSASNRATVTRRNIDYNNNNNDTNSIGYGELVSAGNRNIRNNYSTNFTNNRAFSEISNPLEKTAEKRNTFENSNKALKPINNEKNTEESLDKRVDRYLREKGIISGTYGSSNRNTFNSNLSTGKEDTRPTAVFGSEKQSKIDDYKNNNQTNINSSLNEKEISLSQPTTYSKTEFDINKIINKDKKEDLKTSTGYDYKVISNKIDAVPNKENHKKFSIEENIYKINSPLLDNQSESLEESEFNILLKSRRSINHHPIKDILNDSNNKEQEIQKLASPKTDEKYNLDFNSNEKEKNVKSDLDDVFGFFNNKEAQKPINSIENVGNPAEKVNKNLLDFDFTQKENSNVNDDKDKINIQENYKPAGENTNPKLIDLINSNSLDAADIQNNKPSNQGYNVFDNQEKHETSKELKFENLESTENHVNTENNENNPDNNGDDYDYNSGNKNNENNDLLNNIQNENFNPHVEEDQTFSLEDFREEALRYNNFKRLLHSAEGLNPSEELENRAQEWAEYLAEKETIENRNLVIEAEEVGESLACISYSLSGEKLIEEWYSQIEKYNFENPRKKNSTANFTQMVWKGTNYVGFGAKKSQSGYYFAVAFYYPIGNIEEQYAENVLPIDENIINQINQMNQMNENENENENGNENEDEYQNEEEQE